MEDSIYDLFGEDEIFYEEEYPDLSIQYQEELEYDDEGDPFFDGDCEEDVDYQEQLTNIPMREIETFLRRKKLENIRNENT